MLTTTENYFLKMRTEIDDVEHKLIRLPVKHRRLADFPLKNFEKNDSFTFWKAYEVKSGQIAYL